MEYRHVSWLPHPCSSGQHPGTSGSWLCVRGCEWVWVRGCEWVWVVSVIRERGRKVMLITQMTIMNLIN